MRRGDVCLLFWYLQLYCILSFTSFLLEEGREEGTILWVASVDQWDAPAGDVQRLHK